MANTGDEGVLEALRSNRFNLSEIIQTQPSHGEPDQSRVPLKEEIVFHETLIVKNEVIRESLDLGG